MGPLRVFRHLYAQVVVAIVVGAALGLFWPEAGVALKPLGDGFIKLVKMLITPIVFTTVVVGIAGIGDMRRVGAMGLKALVYFEVVSTFSLLLGLGVGHLLQPGAGMHVDPATLDTSGLTVYTTGAAHLGAVDFILNLIPTTLVDAFAKGEILQVLVVALLFGFALAGLGERGRAMLVLMERLAAVLFGMVGLVMRFAPLGALGAMAFTIGKFGLGSLVSLASLMAGVYATSLLFVLVVLGAILAACGLGILPLVRYLREELLIVLGTSSSESALPLVMAKLENLGCSRSVVGLVIPTGYSFNLDGTSIYLTMAVIFLSQAMGIPLSWEQQAVLLGVLMLTSKGAATVTGGGFITLAATLTALHTLPVAGMALLLGVDRFMSEARALTNLVGNAVATIVVARWEGELDLDRARRVLAGDPSPMDRDLAVVSAAEASLP